MFDSGKSKKGEKGKGKGKEKGKNQRPSSEGPKKKAEEKGEKEKNAMCFRCNRKGHYQSNCHARTDKDGNPLGSNEKANASNEQASKGSANAEGKGKSKGGKGKSKKGKGKIQELVVEESPASRAWNADPSAPLSPFVASNAAFSAPCLRTMADFENSLTLEDRVWGGYPLESLDSNVVETLFCDEISLSCGNKSGKLAVSDLDPGSMPFLMPTLSGSQQESSDVFWWLLDSGASASVVSSRFLSEYEVLHRVDLPTDKKDGFSSASGEVIVPNAAVCVRAFFRMTSIEDPSMHTLKECLIAAFVADVPNNVVSLGTLLKKGWCLGNQGAQLRSPKTDTNFLSPRGRTCHGCMTKVVMLPRVIVKVRIHPRGNQDPKVVQGGNANTFVLVMHRFHNLKQNLS